MSKKLLFRFFALMAAMMCALGMQAAEAYACYTPSDSTLTFYYDNLRSTRTGTTYSLNEGNNTPGWYTDGTKSSVTRVVFDPSFADARPTTAYRWFREMRNLTTITGMKEYLNTSQVTSMRDMFLTCRALPSVDLAHFITENVTDMTGMFDMCVSLTSLDLSSFNTANVTDMDGMFSSVRLTSLDLSSFNTANVIDMDLMFGYCRNLTTIWVGDGWSTENVIYSDEMFIDCVNLVGGMGTTFDEYNIEAEYAHIDGGPGNPGYLTDGTRCDPVMIPAQGQYINLTSFRADWTDETPEALVDSYTLEVSPKNDRAVLLHSLSGTSYPDSYADITLPQPWGGTNVRGGHDAIYIKNDYQDVAIGTITYTIPEGYTNATFTLLITSGQGDNGIGNITVYTPQTAEVGHNFSSGEAFTWQVTASSGEQITVYTTDTNYSPDIALIEVFAGSNFTFDPSQLLHSLSGTNYPDSYADITLPQPWGGTNVRGGHDAIYIKNDYQDVAIGTITYTIPEGYTNATFTLLITSAPSNDGAGNITVYTPQTAGVGHNFSSGETFTWQVTASSGDQITVYTTDASYSPDIDLIEVYYGANFSFAHSQLFTGITNKYYLVKNLEAGGTYLYKVKAIYVDGRESEWSNVEEVTLSDTPAFTRGDVNGDNNVSIADVTALIDYLLSGDASSINLDAADCNQDNGVSIADVTALIDYLLSASWPN